jgi:AcrR family transcriptional regulator
MAPRRKKDMPRREEFLAAALARLSKHGYSATSTRDICADVGLVHSAIYNYFPSKEAVVLAIEERDMTAMLAELEEIVRDSESEPGRRLVEVVTYVFNQATQRRSSWRLLADMLRSISAQSRVIVVERRDTFQRIVTEAIEDAIGAGLAGPVNVRTATLHLFGIAEGMSGWYRPGGVMTREEVVADAVTFILRAIEAKPKLLALVRTPTPKETQRTPRGKKPKETA